MLAALVMDRDLPARMFTPDQLLELTKLADLDPGMVIDDLAAADPALLDRVEIILTGWGSPRVDAAELDRMPHLRAVVHTAGTVRFVAGDALWSREDIVLTSATAANAVPVAEFTLAWILLAGKNTLALEHTYRSSYGRDRGAPAATGCYGSAVGLIGASHIGRLVAGLLRPFDMEVLIADPFVDAAGIAALGARKVELDELFAVSDVVSLHAPDVPPTQGMVDATLLASMRDGATFINTARPTLVDIDALRAELVQGRISAVLDVHDDLSPDDPLWDLPGIAVTPHLAGSQGNELHRMAESAIEEVRRLVRGQAPAHPVDRARREVIA
ncbi:hydroxyacid dehydrogenase [Brachybacterium sp. AOP25-B2-12]|uniref:hydroxyacid dehydrogenase n=1 Tax=Brachybacterium sp. AOP25-B2-12 TaxID=3457710 RepID=UPI004033CDBF